MVRRFEDRSVLVTGAGTGMGRAAALRLATEGASVTLWGRRREPLDAVAADIHALGGQTLVQTCDIADPEAVESNLAALVAHFGGLHGVFANAGHLGPFKPVRETAAEDFADLLAINLIGTQQTVIQSLQHMTAGSVVINASWTARAVMPGTGAYAATKAALIGLMQTLAVEEGPMGNRVNSISPGIILTPMAEEALDRAVGQQLQDHTPLRRNGTPADICGSVAWLLSEDAAFVTGQDIAIDGGFTLGGALR